MTFSKQLLSGSTNGKMIAVTGTTSGAADTIHTAIAGTSALDEIWLWAINTDTTARKLTLLFGGTTTADTIEVYIEPESGLVPVLAGQLLQNELILKAFAESASVVNLIGYVNRIS